MTNPFLSFVIPAKNEEENVEKLYLEIVREVKKVSKNYEIIFVDDGSTDDTAKIIQKIQDKDKKVKLVKHRGNWGKSIALQNGFNEAKGDITLTLDADLQDNPKEISNFINKIKEGYDLVSGWKKQRHDPLSKVIPSRIFNFLISKLTKVKVRDTNCGFKAYKKEVIKNLNLYGELYRFIPVLAAKQNYRITEIKVDHRPRKYGKTKYGWGRNIKGFLDLITIIFLTGYLSRPSHFFGTLGLASFGIGFIIGLYISYLRISTGSIQFRHPLLYLGMLLMIIGIQLITTGLLAEMLLNLTINNKPKNTIEKIT